MSWPAQRLVRMMEVGEEDPSSHDRELEGLISTYWMMMEREATSEWFAQTIFETESNVGDGGGGGRMNGCR